ncbi:outer membrane beta-barrel protein [Pseudorhodoplanes sinuspersici]|uniref:Uncharacterized protein n=1 Tax=Pseudorhodoplanes sinuspersici TaxID=1235591 RepID=A0A1W6ZYP7_9HYPH|nr:outer membrane beta-barrel protein [Pseudorhodoplanes sinuspersici]ARQ02430.1 hypothetical protein CAK95_27470 [Pseudorhodoplanes sinuspersici]RKE74266.1 hypothetical protein DFP91_2170 [Pseudorhodoplanes sinuspersici]
MLLFGTAVTSTAGFADEALPDYEMSRIPVGERVHPGYEPIGYRVGGVFFYPRLLAGMRFDSNVFATPTNAQSDIYFVLSPQLTVKYGRGTPGAELNPSRFSYQIDLGADIYRFRKFDSENRVDARGRITTNWDIAPDLQFDTAFEAARRHEERGDSSQPQNAAKPVPYNDLRGEATLTKTWGRFGVALNAGVRNLTYEDVDTFGGAVLDQTQRDGTIVSTYIKPFYEFSPGYRAFARLRGNWREYAATGTQNRNSDGYEARGGVEFALTPLISGSVEAGYMSQTYENPLILPVDGLSLKGELLWLATALITVRANAERAVAETITPGFGPRLDTLFGGQIEYELLRNVIVKAGGSFKQEDFQDSPRKDDVTRWSAGIDYTLNRHLSIGGRYDFVSRESTIPTYSFDKHVVMFNVTAQY